MKIFDMHADIGTNILEVKEQQGFDKNVLMENHYDKLIEGQIAWTAIACYFTGTEDWQRMQKMVLTVEEEISQSPVHQILSPQSFLRSQPLNVIVTVEGMCGIQDQPEEKIQWLYDHGVRIASLCWNEQNALASGKDGSCLRGLTALGKRAVLKMNELNMVIDVSHANEKTFWDILEVSSKPVIATHSNVRHFAQVDRNLSDQQLLALAQKGGLTGLNAAKSFIDDRPEHQDAAHLAEHAAYIKEMVGIDALGIGFDFMDFFAGHGSSMGNDLSSARQAQNLIAALREYFSEDEIERIAYKNTLEFLKKWL